MAMESKTCTSDCLVSVLMVQILGCRSRDKVELLCKEHCSSPWTPHFTPVGDLKKKESILLLSLMKILPK